jgi:hypothetical protein
MTDISGREITLFDAKFHIGTMAATGWPYTIGQDLQTKEWHRVYLHEMKTMEHRMGPPDPVTGMEHLMVARVVKQDGERQEIMGCKSCTLSGFRADGRKEGYTGSEVKKIVILDPNEVCPPAPVMKNPHDNGG